ncbi:hypothetical protein Ctob_006657 [Chrysochromulina tobinii]|uniref:Uncharacterized protein n=1 Tax=Chrysochromulina tobinii TaxID=1460289 RepID=A0A0M0JQI0_9EUKA|nr:hypothetical protein Ctob_006657 [Chrysochromulina tobinii]|eukprot:KOO28740.1 hypothetical protein Ctob_006657 [Chrysochromulina sp. CCMP291]
MSLYARAPATEEESAKRAVWAATAKASAEKAEAAAEAARKQKQFDDVKTAIAAAKDAKISVADFQVLLTAAGH